MFCRSCAAPLGPAQPVFQQQSPPFQQWGQPQPGGPMMAQPQPGFAPPPSNRPVIALCLVIAGFLCCGPILSIPGAILGWMEMTAIKEGRAPQSGLTMSQIAFWGGIAISILSSIGIVIGILMMLAGNGF
ncbi:MAG: hypothetical protein IPJ30_27535 [Acidobacteria bacterium]|nr:hypothetical protein [Acidobacteriota bacterium]MBK8147935.1 hypothetical protein [Acidobacteriota bacterium]